MGSNGTAFDLNKSDKMPSKRVLKKKVKEEKENIVKTEVIASASGSKENKMPSIRGTKRKFIEEENNIIKEESDYDDDDYPVDYEQKRLQNIAARKAKIDELKISDISFELTSDLNVSKNKNASRRGLSAIPQQQRQKEILPPRKSLRLQNIDADTGLQLPEKEPTHYRIFDQYEEPQRLPLQDLNLDDLCNNNEDCETTSNYFDLKIKPFLNEDTKVKLQKSFFENDVANMEKNLKKLNITAERVAKVVPDRIFSLAIHPSQTKLLVATGGKWGAIGFWDVNDNESKTHGVQVVKHHSRPVNCLTYDIFDSSKLISTSYDGTVRIFDINEKKSSVLFGVPEDDASYTTYHAQVDKDCFLVTLGRTGLVGLIDKRISHLKPATNFKLYEKVSPKVVSLHPIKRNLFLAPSNKGDCGIFDMRNANKNGTLMKPLTQLIGHTKAISSAFFSPKTGSRVVSVAYDNKLRIYDTSDDKFNANHIKPYKSITHNNQTGRWLTTFKAEWHPGRDDISFVGSMTQPRQIDAYSDKGDHFVFNGEHLASVCSIVKCHPTQDIIVGGNSSGRVHVFMQ